MSRFVLLEGTIDDFTDEQENKNTRAKFNLDVSLIKTFLRRKAELRNVDEIPPADIPPRKYRDQYPNSPELPMVSCFCLFLLQSAYSLPKLDCSI